MRMNKMTSYAIRIVSRMAMEGRRMTSKELMEAEAIPHGVLMKILRMLKNGGVVEAHQGRGGLTGGYSLSEEAEKISVYHLLIVMEGEMNMHPEIEKEYYKDGKQALYDTLEVLNEEWVRRLQEVRISDFAK